MPGNPLLIGAYWLDLDSIRQRHAAGANPDALDSNGSTPLTEAILGGTGYPEVVKLLLQLGANPNLEDANGYTPWLACLMRLPDPVVEDEQRCIRALLETHGASRAGEEHLQLQNAAAIGDLAAVQALLDQGLPAQTRITSPLQAALSADHLQVAELLLRHGASVDGQGEAYDLTPLMRAANAGRSEAARLLVAYGADVMRAQEGDDGFMTAAWYARSNGHDALADWLAGLRRGAERQPIPRSARSGGPRAKFIELYRCHTSAPDRGLDTAKIVDQLLKWDKAHGIQVSEVCPDRLCVHFAQLPDDTRKLAREIVRLCPDVIDQGFGCLGEVLEDFAERGSPLPDDLQALCEGLDPTKRDFGIQLLQRSLQLQRRVSLWWD